MIKTPVQFDYNDEEYPGGFGIIHDANDKTVCETHESVADEIVAALNERAELLAEVERLKESLHKCDGMANEINILTAENRKLDAEIAEAIVTVDVLRKQQHEDGYTINRLTDEIEAMRRNDG